MRKHILVALMLVLSLSAWGQADRREVRAGNRKFRKDAFKEAEIDYRKAVLKDTASVAGQYDLASALYRQEDFASAAKALDAVKNVAPATPHAADYYYNRGDVALRQKDYAAAVEAFKQSLLRRPDDVDAKENYLYAKKMLEDQQQNGGGGGDGQNDQNQDQNQDQQNQDQNQQNRDQNQQNQDQNQDQNQQNQDQQNQQQDQPQDQNQNQNQDQGQPQPQEAKISPQQAQQMIQAIQAKEKETQDKVNKKKAALLQSRKREKNW